MGTNKPRTKQDNYTKATSQQMSERQSQDTGVLPGPKLKYHRCSSAIGKKEKRKSTNKHGEFKTHSWRAQTAHRARLKMCIQLQRHLLLGRCLCWAPCPKSYFNHWKSCSCGQGSPVELPKHRHVALLVMPQAHCLVASSCSRWTCASCRSHRTFQDWTVRTSQHQKVSQMSQKS